MSLVATLAVLAVTVLLTPVFEARWRRAAGWPLAALYLLATACFAPAAAQVWRGGTPAWSIPWVPSLRAELALRADGLGVVFALVALLVGVVVFAYSTAYLDDGPQLSFYLVMTAFTFSMVALVLADDMALLFVCWELTSIASFLLVARSGRGGEAASMRTLLVTFVGGLALLVAVVVVAQRTGTTRLSAALVDPVWRQEPGLAALVAALVAVAGFTKSAQFPFHVWLPDAMAAITPVSAYLHAAAVVKAGVFLLMRFTPAVADVPLWNVALVVTGLFTAALGARSALRQHDLKRLMAYSTVSQLGLVVATIGVGTAAALAAATVHVVAHALFKSGLFMMVGVVDHSAHTRDLRRLPALRHALPGSFAVTALGCAAMAGLPPLLGFVSKESMFTALAHAPGPAWAGPLALLAAAGASVLTFAYCAKVVLGAFVDGTRQRPVERPSAVLVGAAALPIVAGLPLGLAAGVLDVPLDAAARAARPGAPVEVELALWHGLTPELGATLAVFALGTLLVAARRRAWPWLERPGRVPDGPHVIGTLVEATVRLGAQLARPVAGEHATRHLVPPLAAFAAVVFAGLASATFAVGLPAATPGLTRPIDVVLCVLVGAAVLVVCVAQRRLAATVALSAVGMVVTVQIFSLGAPDVGLTQLLVESLTVVVVMLVLQKLPTRFAPLSRLRASGSLAVALGVGLAAGSATFVLSGRRGRSDVARYYIDHTEAVSGGHNIVNVILVEFRALDTLGELSVLGFAGVAVVAVLSTVRATLLDPARRPDDDEGGPVAEPELRASDTPAHAAITSAWSNAVALQLMLRFTNPVLAVLSALIFVRGHNAPGGGFIAALVGSAIVALVYVSTSRDRQVGPPRLPLHLIGGGVGLAVLTGLWGLVAGGSFLEPLHARVGPVALTSSMLFDAGVYAAVLGLVMIAFNLLGTSAVTAGEPGGEGTRERVDEAVEGELPGPLDTVRGEPAEPVGGGRARVGVGTSFLSSGRPPRQPGREADRR